MAIKMRNNIKDEAICCECGESQKQVLNMFDLCVGGNIFTICDACNEKLFRKCLSAECYKNARVKSPQDINIINNRKRRIDTILIEKSNKKEKRNDRLQ